MSKSGLFESFRRLAVPGTVLFLTAAAASVTAAQSSGSGLLSHRAVYGMSQHTGSSASDIVGVNGRLELTFEVACDGWRMEQYIGFRLFHSEGAGLEHVAHLSGWETTDGAEFWFSSRSYQDRRLLEELSGVARLDEPGGSGETRFAKPQEEVRPLPEGTIFPAKHLEELIATAKSGGKHLTRTVFDGSTMDSPYEITAFIGRERPSGNETVPAIVSGKRSWPFRLAYFKVETLQPTPEFELSAILYENGVAGDMIYDYGDFAIDVELHELEVLPVPECEK
jgi:hypothetical protein